MENDDSMHIGLPTLEFTVYVHVKKARSNMTLEQKRLYMECLEISIHHRLCTDLTCTLVYKNLHTTIISNSLALCFFTEVMPMMMIKRGP